MWYVVWCCAVKIMCVVQASSPPGWWFQEVEVRTPPPQKSRHGPRLPSPGKGLELLLLFQLLKLASKV